MCAIGRNLDSSIGAQAPATAMLGTGAIGAPRAAVRTTLLTGVAPRGGTGTGAGGTILAPNTTPRPRPGKVEPLEP